MPTERSDPRSNVTSPSAGRDKSADAAAQCDDAAAAQRNGVLQFIQQNYLLEAQEFVRKGHNAIVPTVDATLLPALQQALAEAEACLAACTRSREAHDMRWGYQKLSEFQNTFQQLSVEIFGRWIDNELKASRLVIEKFQNKHAAQLLATHLSSALEIIIRAVRALEKYARTMHPGSLRALMLLELDRDLRQFNAASLSAAVAKLEASEKHCGPINTVLAAIRADALVELKSEACAFRKGAKAAHRYTQDMTNDCQRDVRLLFKDIARLLLCFSRELGERVTPLFADTLAPVANGSPAAKLERPINTEKECRGPLSVQTGMVIRLKKAAVCNIGNLYLTTLVTSLTGRQAYHSIARRVGSTLLDHQRQSRAVQAGQAAVRCVLWQWQRCAHELQQAGATVHLKLKQLKKIEREFRRCTVKESAHKRCRPARDEDADDDCIEGHVQRWLVDRMEQTQPGVRTSRQLDLLKRLLQADLDGALATINRVGCTQSAVETKLFEQLADTAMMIGEQVAAEEFDALHRCVPYVANDILAAAHTLRKSIDAVDIENASFSRGCKKAKRAQLKAVVLAEYLSAASSSITGRALDSRSIGSRLAVHWARLANGQFGVELPVCNAAPLHASMKVSGLFDGTLPPGDPDGYLLATRLATELKDANEGRIPRSLRPNQYVALEKSLTEFVLKWGQRNAMNGLTRQFVRLACDGAMITLFLGCGVLIKTGVKLALAAVTIPYKIQTVNKYVMPGDDIDYEAVFAMLGKRLGHLGFKLITTQLPWAAKLAAGTALSVATVQYNRRNLANEHRVTAVFEIVTANKKDRTVNISLQRTALSALATDSAIFLGAKVCERAVTQATGVYVQYGDDSLSTFHSSRPLPAQPKPLSAAVLLTEQRDLERGKVDTAAGLRTRRSALDAHAPMMEPGKFFPVAQLRDLSLPERQRFYTDTLTKILSDASGDPKLPVAVRERAMRAADGASLLQPVMMTAPRTKLVNVFIVPDDHESKSGLLINLSQAGPRWQYVSGQDNFPLEYFENISGDLFFIRVTKDGLEHLPEAAARRADFSQLRLMDRSGMSNLLQRGDWRFDQLSLWEEDPMTIDSLSRELAADSESSNCRADMNVLYAFEAAPANRYIDKFFRKDDLNTLAQYGASDFFLIRLVEDSINADKTDETRSATSAMGEQSAMLKAQAKAKILNASRMSQVVQAFNAVSERKITLYEVFKGRFLSGIATESDLREISPDGKSAYQVFSDHGEAQIASQNVVADDLPGQSEPDRVTENEVFEQLPEDVKHFLYTSALRKRLHRIASEASTPDALRAYAMTALNGASCLYPAMVNGLCLADMFYIPHRAQGDAVWLINLSDGDRLFILIENKSDVPAQYFENLTGSAFILPDDPQSTHFREAAPDHSGARPRRAPFAGKKGVISLLQGGQWNIHEVVDNVRKSEALTDSSLAAYMVQDRRLQRYERQVAFNQAQKPRRADESTLRGLAWMKGAVVDGEKLLKQLKDAGRFTEDWIKGKRLDPRRKIVIRTTVGSGKRARHVRKTFYFMDFITGSASHYMTQRLTTHGRWRYELTAAEQQLIALRAHLQTDYRRYLDNFKRQNGQALDDYMSLHAAFKSLQKAISTSSDHPPTKSLSAVVAPQVRGDGSLPHATALMARLEEKMQELIYSDKGLERGHVLSVLNELTGAVGLIHPAASLKTNLLITGMRFGLSKLQESNASAPEEKEMFRNAALNGLTYDVILQSPVALREFLKSRAGGSLLGRFNGIDGTKSADRRGLLGQTVVFPSGELVRPTTELEKISGPYGIDTQGMFTSLGGKMSDVALHGNSLQVQGIYRNTYLVSCDGVTKHYLKQNDSVYEVFWDNDSETMRIRARGRSQKEDDDVPVRLQNGRWCANVRGGLRSGGKDPAASRKPAKVATARGKAPPTVGFNTYNRASSGVNSQALGERVRPPPGTVPGFDERLRVKTFSAASLKTRPLVVRGEFAGAYRHANGRYYFIKNQQVFEVVADRGNAALKIRDPLGGGYGPTVFFDARDQVWKLLSQSVGYQRSKPRGAH